MTFNEYTVWLVVGFMAQGLFFARFLVQWIVSEKKKKSVIPLQFWFFSLAGGTLLLVYAIHRKDPVFIVGQGAGLVIYARNLMLIHKGRNSSTPDDPVSNAASHLRCREGDQYQRVEGSDRSGIHFAPLTSGMNSNVRKYHSDLSRFQGEGVWFSILLAASFLFIFFQLGSRSLENHYYIRYAEAARKMLRLGDWIVPRLRGDLFVHKPPLCYTLVCPTSFSCGRTCDHCSHLLSGQDEVMP